MTRAIDHLVLPVTSLSLARQRYEALGFHVNADGIHPFGTANCCIFFENETFLEPLAVHEPELIQKNLAKNSFVSVDNRFRAQAGDEGFSAVALQSDNPQADEEAFQDAGLAGPSMLSFQRKAVNEDGSEDMLSVDGGFCIHRDIDTLAFFTCCWIGNPGTIQRIKKAGSHINATNGVTAVTLVAPNPEAVIPYLNIAFDDKFQENEAGTYSLVLPNGQINLFSSDRFHASTGQKSASGLLSAASFTVESFDINQTRDTLVASNIVFEVRDNDIIVPPAPGQGTTIIFTNES